MAQHTPGPWSFLEGEDDETPTSGPLTICDRANLDDLANVYSRDDATVSVPFEEAIANARLIAAAPDLLDALTLLVRHCELGGYDGAPVDLARALLDRISPLKSAA